jgi:hypothetical protein
VAQHQGKELARTFAKVQILPDTRELLQPRARPETLVALAEAADGKVLHTPHELISWLSQLPVNEGNAVITRQPIWDSPVLWLVIVGLLGFEWVLRRLAGYG